MSSALYSMVGKECAEVYNRRNKWGVDKINTFLFTYLQASTYLKIQY